MNTINLCRPVPALPIAISHDLLVVQMLTLEQYLRETNPIFEEDLYMGLLEKLAGIYIQVNQFPVRSRNIYFSAVAPPVEFVEVVRRTCIRKINQSERDSKSYPDYKTQSK